MRRRVAARLVLADGPAAFDGEAEGVVPSAALDTLAALDRLGCRRFRA